jgi:hypothetical protein
MGFLASAQEHEHGFPDEDTARRVLAVRIGDLAARRSGLRIVKPSGPLSGLVDAWLKVRRGTHRSADQDEYRWRKHLEPSLGRKAPDDVDVAMLKKIVTAKLADGLSPATGRLLMRLVSTLYTDLIRNQPRRAVRRTAGGTSTCWGQSSYLAVKTTCEPL